MGLDHLKHWGQVYHITALTAVDSGLSKFTD